MAIVFYLLPMLKRWLQLKGNNSFVRRTLRKGRKKEQSLREIRDRIESRLFKRTKWASNHFRSFRLAWTEARLPGHDKACTPVRLRDYLTRTTVVQGATNEHIASAWPSIFVSTGILGTFFGLYLGLKGIKIDQLENLQQGVGQLISGLSLAFLTSLVGITLSVVFLLSHRFLLRRIEKSFLRLDTRVAEVYPCESQEQYQRTFTQLQEEIKQGMQSLATDIATKMSDVMEPAMGKAMANHLAPVLENIEAVFRTHLEKSEKNQCETMEHALKQYVDHMNASFGNQFQEMSEVIAETTRAQKEIKQDIVDFGERLERQYTVQTQLVEQTSRAGELLGSSLDGLYKISRELNAAADHVSSAALNLDAAAEKAKVGHETVRQTMERHIETMAATRDEFERTWSANIENANAVLSLIREVVRELGEGVGEHLSRALESFDTKVAEVTERFSGTLFETKETIDEIPSLFLRLEPLLNALEKDISIQKQTVVEIKEMTVEFVKPNFEALIGISEELRKSFGTFKNVSETLIENIQKAASFFNAAGHRNTEFAQSLDTSVNRLAESLSAMSASFQNTGNNGDVSKELCEYIRKMTEGQHTLQNQMGHVADEFSKVAAQIKVPEQKTGLFNRFMKK